MYFERRGNAGRFLGWLPFLFLLLALLVGCSDTGSSGAGQALPEDGDPGAVAQDGTPGDLEAQSGSLLRGAGPACQNSAMLVADVTVPDGTELQPGSRFAKTWRIRNTGNCTWEAGTTLVQTGGDLRAIVEAVNVPITAPDAEVDVSVGFIAPEEPGDYASFWQLRMADGEELENVFPVRILVTDSPGPTATPLSSLPQVTTSAGVATALPTATAAPPPTSTPAPPPTVAPAATPTPAPTEGWLGEYFNNPWLNGQPLATRIDPEIDFDWGTGAPFSPLPSNQFSVRWTRELPFEAGNYRFFARSDDGIRVYVDNQLIIDEWQPVQDRTFQADKSLTSGRHEIRVEYYEDIQFASVQFWWEAQSEFRDWRGEYFANQFLSGSPALVREDRAISFNWGLNAPAPNLPKDRFSVRWTRTQQFRAGTYRFHAIVDDGARVYVNNILIIDAWQSGNLREVTGTATLSAGDHFIRVEYFEDTLEAAVYFWWDDGTSFPDWRGEYWANQNLNGLPELIRNDREINFRWQFDSPAPEIPVDNFSARWARLQTFERGLYRLNVVSDDGARVYVDGDLVINRWFDGPANQTYSAELVLDGLHSVVVTYYENVELASIRFWIERIGDAP